MEIIMNLYWIDIKRLFINNYKFIKYLYSKLIMNLYWIDIKRFLNNYYKLIFLLSALFSVLFAGIMFFTKEEAAIEEGSLAEENIGFFTEDSKPSYFRFYIEQS